MLKLFIQWTSLFRASSLPIGPQISNMQTLGIDESEPSTCLGKEIELTIRALKLERDTWRNTAEQYQAAFEEQTERLHDLLDICIATQAELENERTAHHHRHARFDSTLPESENRSSNHCHENQPFGTAIILRKTSGETIRRPLSCFSRVQRLCEQHDYGSALREVDHLLRGPLTSESRVEGLLIKSDILRKLDLLYDALAACSEALDLCDQLQTLHAQLPRIHYQRGICYYQLRMTKQAREALSKVFSEDNSLSAKARDLLDSCDDPINSGRRSGFESHRIQSDGSLQALSEVRIDVAKRRSASSQFRLHMQKGKSLSIPRRWITPRSSSAGGN